MYLVGCLKIELENALLQTQINANISYEIPCYKIKMLLFGSSTKKVFF